MKLLALALLFIAPSIFAMTPKEVATYNPGPKQLAWHALGTDDHADYWYTANQLPVGFVVTVKRAQRSLTKGYSLLTFIDVQVTCRNGLPDDEAGLISAINIDPATEEYISQVRSAHFHGDYLPVQPGSAIARAAIIACAEQK